MTSFYETDGLEQIVEETEFNEVARAGPASSASSALCPSAPICLLLVPLCHG
jgi:hypothetical protein